MGAFNQPGESWVENHEARERELEQLQPGSLQYASCHQLVRGECVGCGAPFAYSRLQNANAPGGNECAYCKRPRSSFNDASWGFGRGAT